jgi:hypothetical protein
VLYGPVALALACGLARRPVVAAAAAALLLAAPLPAKSNVRAVAVSAGIGLRPGDLVISTQPEQWPALHAICPPGSCTLTPLGTPADPTVVDWRDALRRLRPPRAFACGPAGGVVLVHPRRAPRPRAVEPRDPPQHAPLARRAATRPAAVRRRRHVPSRPGAIRSTVRAELFRVCVKTRGGR